MHDKLLLFSKFLISPRLTERESRAICRGAFAPKKNMGLKHRILPNNRFKTHLFFSIFGWGDPFQLGSWSEGWTKL